MKTTKQKEKSKADLRREQITADSNRAVDLIKAYAAQVDQYNAIVAEANEKARPIKEETEKKLKPIKDEYDPKVETAMAVLKETTEQLTEIGKRQRFNLFDVKNNWHFENGFYLHVKSNTQAVPGPAFDLPKFVERFLAYTKVDFEVEALKKVHTNADHPDRAELLKQDLNLETTETIEIKKKKKTKSKNEQEEQAD